MRVWDCDPRLLCDKHLRAQHAEIHFAIRVIENGWRTKWMDVERFRTHPHGIDWLAFCHNITVATLVKRGQFKNHQTPVQELDYPFLGYQEIFFGGWMLEYMSYLLWKGYPRTELNQGTPWERDGVSFEWYRDHQQDWTRQLAREAARVTSVS